MSFKDEVGVARAILYKMPKIEIHRAGRLAQALECIRRGVEDDGLSDSEFVDSVPVALAVAATLGLTDLKECLMARLCPESTGDLRKEIDQTLAGLAPHQLTVNETPFVIAAERVASVMQQATGVARDDLAGTLQAIEFIFTGHQFVGASDKGRESLRKARDAFMAAGCLNIAGAVSSRLAMLEDPDSA